MGRELVLVACLAAANAASFLAHFYSTPALAPRVIRRFSTIDFDWASDWPSYAALPEATMMAEFVGRYPIDETTVYTICIDGTDGLELTVDDALVVDELDAVTGTARELCSPPLSRAAGTALMINVRHTTTAQSGGVSLLVSTPSQPRAVMDLSGVASASVGGLLGRYFRSPDVAGELAVVRVDPDFDQDFSDDQLGAVFSGHPLSVRWTGVFTPSSTSSSFTFCVTTSTDAGSGARLWIDGTGVLDSWTTGGQSCGLFGQMVADQRYPVLLEYHGALGTGNLLFEYETTESARQTVPSWELDSDLPLLDSPFLHLPCPTPGGDIVIGAAFGWVSDGLGDYTKGQSCRFVWRPQFFGQISLNPVFVSLDNGRDYLRFFDTADWSLPGAPQLAALTGQAETLSPVTSSSTRLSLVFTTSGGGTPSAGFSVEFRALNVVPQPVITSLYPRSARSSGSGVLTLSGWIASSENEVTITIGGAPCPVIPGTLTDGGASISCTYPSKPGNLVVDRTQVIRVTNSFGAGSNPPLFSYITDPSVTSVAPSAAGPGDVVFVTGQFGADPTIDMIRVVVGAPGVEVDCPVMPGSLTSPGGVETVQCALPPNPSPGTRDHPVAVYFRDVRSASSATVRYLESLGDLPVNLARNGGCESGSRSPHWSLDEGQWDCSTARPYMGGYSLDPRNGDTRAHQDVDVTWLATFIDAGAMRFSASAWLYGVSGFVLNNHVQFKAFFLNAQGANLGSTLDSGEKTGNRWERYSGSAVAPSGTRTVRLEINSDRTIQTTNEAHVIDNVALTAATLWAVCMDNSGVTQTLTSTFQGISSGPYPYEPRMDCSLRIQPASFSGNIWLDFAQFDTEAGGDFVTVYDGPSASAPVLGEYSGTSLPPSLRSSGNTMLVRFRTSGGVTASGFAAFYTAVANPQVVSVEPAGGVEGTLLTISGSAFGDKEAQLEIRIGDLTCPVVPGSLDSFGTSVLCVAPTPPAYQSYPLRVFHRTVVSAAPNRQYTYFAAPLLQSLFPPMGSGGHTLDISGDFGASESEISITIDDQFGLGVPCPLVPGSVFIDGDGISRASCIVPPSDDTSVARRVRLYRYETVSPFVLTFEYALAPTILSVSPSAGQASSLVTITALDIVGEQDALEIYFGDALCAISSFEPPNRITCNAPDLSGSQFVRVARYQLVSPESNTHVFSYVSPPAIADISPSGGAFGTVLSITGTDFGPDAAARSVTVGGVDCPLDASSISVLVCTVPELPVTTHPVIASYYDLVSAPPHPQFAYTGGHAATSVEPVGSAPGSRITIRGTRFGNDPGAIRAVVGGLDCPLVDGSLNVAGTAIECTVPNGLALGVHDVVVEIFGVAADTPFPIFNAVRPLLAQLLPAGGLAGTVISITGALGTVLDEDELSVSVGGSPCLVQAGSVESDGSSLRCAVPAAGLLGPAAVTVSHYGTVSTNNLDFVYVAPPIVSLLEPRGGQTGTLVTVRGTGFGDQASDVAVEIDGRTCTLEGSVAVRDDLVACRAPVPSTIEAKSVVVRRYQVPSSEVAEFLYVLPPSVAQLTPSGGVAGSEVELSGNFGSSCAEADFRATIDGQDCAIVADSLAADCSSLSCVAPVVGSNGPKATVLTRFDVDSIGTVSFEYVDAPTIDTVSPQFGVPGDEITITGTGLGAEEADLDIRIGSVFCPVVPLSLTGGSSVRCTATGPTSLGQVPVQLSRFGIPSNSDKEFTYVRRPSVVGVAPRGGPVAGGTVLTVFGSDLGSDAALLDILVGTVPCAVDTNTLDAAGTSVQCLTGSNGGSGAEDLPVTVRVAGVDTATVDPPRFVYALAPEVTGLDPPQSFAGQQLRVDLTDLSLATPVAPTVDDVQVLIGGLPCPTQSVAPGPPSSVVCTLPPKAPGFHDVEFVLFSTIGSAEAVRLQIEYENQLVLSGLAPPEGLPGSLVTLSGGGFAPPNLAVTVGGVACDAIVDLLADGTGLGCIVPASLAQGPHTVVVSNSLGTTTEDPAFLAITSPEVAGVAPPTGVPGIELTVSGSGFGPAGVVDDDRLSVTVGGLPCGAVEVLSDSQVRCTGPNLPTGAQSIALSRYETDSVYTAEQVQIVYFDLPTVQAVSPRGALSPVRLTLTGRSFGDDASLLVVHIGNATQCAVDEATLTGNDDSVEQTVECDLAAPGPAPGQALGVSVERANQPGLVGAVFVVPRAPEVSLVLPAFGQADQVVVLRGSGFGHDPDAVVVLFAPGIEASVTRLADDEITCVVPLAAESGDVVVSLYGATSEPAFFEMALRPTLLGVLPRGGVPGTEIVLAGSSFGTSSSEISVMAGARPCVVVGAVTDDQVRCTVGPLSLLGPLSVQLARGSLQAQNELEFEAIASPVISSVSPRGAAVAALPVLVTVTGFGFGQSLDDLSVQLVDDDMLPVGSGRILSVEALASGDGSRCICEIDSTTLDDDDVPVLTRLQIVRYAIASEAQQAGADQFELVGDHQVTAIAPPGGGAGIEVAVTVEGLATRRADWQGSVRVVLGEDQQECTVTGVEPSPLVDDASWAPTATVSCVMPSGLSGPFAVRVMWYSRESNGRQFVFAAPPVATSVTPSGGTRSRTITLTGINFPSSEDNIEVELNGQPCEIVPGTLDADLGVLKCTTPDLPVGDYVVEVTSYRSLRERAGSGRTRFRYVDAPRVSAAEPAGGIGGQAITLLGSLFGDDEDELIVLVGGRPAAVVPGSLHPQGTSLVVEAPGGFEAGPQDIQVSRLAVSSSDAPAQFQFITVPQILATSPLGGMPGTVLSINATGMGLDVGDVGVEVGGIDCPLVPGSFDGANGTVECVSPTGTLGLHDIVVSRYEVQSRRSLSYQFELVNAPVLISVQPVGGQGGTVVTIEGRNFGRLDATLVQVDGGLACELPPPEDGANPSEQLGSVVTCTMPARAAGVAEIQVSNYGALSQPLEFVFVDAPVVSEVEPLVGEAGQIVTVTGSGFGDSFRDLRVFLGEAGCTVLPESLAPDGTRVECLVPSPPPGPATVSVSAELYGVRSTGTDVQFAFLAEDTRPAVDLVVPEIVPVGSGETLYVIGRNFQDSAALACQFNETQGLSLTTAGTWLSDSIVTCLVTSELGSGEYSVSVTNDGVEFSQPLPGQSNVLQLVAQPTSLALVQAPPAETSNSSLPWETYPIVHVIDNDGKLAVDWDEPVEAVLEPLAFPLAGQAVVPVDGVAEFKALTFTGVHGVDYSLHFTSGVLRGTPRFNFTYLDCATVREGSVPNGRDGGQTCVCPAGLTSQDPRLPCRACPQGTYKEAIGDNECTRCPENTDTQAGVGAQREEDCLCVEKWFRPTPGSDCVECIEGLVCLGSGVVEVEDGYWSLEDDPFEVLACPNPNACNGDKCARGYGGPLCAICQEGFGSLGDSCLPCPNVAANVVVMLLLSMLGMGVLYLFIRQAKQPKSEASVVLRTMVNYLQVLAFMASFEVEWPVQLQDVFRGASAVTIQARIFSLDCTAGPKYFVRLLVILLVPGLIIFALSIIYGVKLVYHRRIEPRFAQDGKPSRTSKQIWDSFQVALSVLLFLAHPGIVREVLLSFRCRDVLGESYLAVDMSVNCRSQEYRSWQVVTTVYLLVYCIGLILVGFFLMKKSHQTYGRLKFRYFQGGYRPSAYYWECVSMARKLLVVVMAVFLAPSVQIFCGSMLFVVSIQLNRLAQPFEREYVARLENLSLWALLATLQTGFLFNYAKLEDGLVVFLAVMVILMDLAVFLAFVWQCFVHYDSDYTRAAVRHIERVWARIIRGERYSPEDDVEMHPMTGDRRVSIARHSTAGSSEAKAGLIGAGSPTGRTSSFVNPSSFSQSSSSIHVAGDGEL